MEEMGTMIFFSRLPLKNIYTNYKQEDEDTKMFFSFAGDMVMV